MINIKIKGIIKIISLLLAHSNKKKWGNSIKGGILIDLNEIKIRWNNEKNQCYMKVCCSWNKSVYRN